MAKDEEIREIPEKEGISDALADFLQRNRKTLIISAAAALIIVAGLIAALGVRNVLRTEAVKAVEALTERYEALRFNINDSSKAEDVGALLADLGVFAEKNSAYAGFRSYALIGSIHGDQKNWPEAEQAWLNAAKKGAKTYFVPVALYNAAIAAEESGNLEAAIGHLQEALVHKDDFPAAARAQFAIGRLEEARGRKEEAIEAYRQVIENWPNETDWTNLANSKILVLSGLNS